MSDDEGMAGIWGGVVCPERCGGDAAFAGACDRGAGGAGVAGGNAEAAEDRGI